MDLDCAIVIERYKAVYVEIAKVASSSLKAVFAELIGFDLTAVDGNPHALEFAHPARAELDGERLFPGLYTFAFVRNPFDRLVSCYRDKIGGEVADFTGMADKGVAHCLAGFDEFTAGMSFDAFVEAVAAIPDGDADEHFRSQHCNLTNSGGKIAVDFVGRYETLAGDFQRVAATIHLPDGIMLSRLQANPRAVHHAAYYTGATRRLVADRYARDIELFGYEFGSGV